MFGNLFGKILLGILFAATTFGIDLHKNQCLVFVDDNGKTSAVCQTDSGFTTTPVSQPWCEVKYFDGENPTLGKEIDTKILGKTDPEILMEDEFWPQIMCVPGGHLDPFVTVSSSKKDSVVQKDLSIPANIIRFKIFLPNIIR